jgi:hypothetical protein
MQMKSVTAVLAIIALSGCSTILNEETQKINITSSNAQPITGSVDGVPFNGPGIVQVKRANADKVVKVDTPDCAKETLLAKQVDSKFFINVLSGGALGSTTDYASEEMWKYDDNVVIQCK